MLRALLESLQGIIWYQIYKIILSGHVIVTKGENDTILMNRMMLIYDIQKACVAFQKEICVTI